MIRVTYMAFYGPKGTTYFGGMTYGYQEDQGIWEEALA